MHRPPTWSLWDVATFSATAFYKGGRGRAHSPSFQSLHLCHSSFWFSKPTSQLILQPFRRFTYVTTHSPTLLLLHLHHSSFSNPSFASPTSQDFHLRHLASCSCLVLIADITCTTMHVRSREGEGGASGMLSLGERLLHDNLHYFTQLFTITFQGLTFKIGK